MASRAKYARRRRNAFLAAIVLAVLFIIIVILIIVSIAGGKKKNNKTTEPLASPTATNEALMTIAPIATDELIDVSPSPEASEEPQNLMYVTGDKVNVRKEPKTGDNILKTLDRGTEVTFVEKDGDFSKVLCDGTECYISSKFLSAEKPSSATATATSASATATPDTSNGKTMYVTADSVNVRKDASSTSDRITRLNKDKSVTAYTTSNGWTYIKYGDGKYGYISSQYLKSSVSTAAPTAAPTTAPTKAPASSFSAIGIPEGIVSKLDSGKASTYLSMTKADQKAGTFSTNDYKYYEIEKIDSSGSYYYIKYKEESEGVYSEVSFTDRVT